MLHTLVNFYTKMFIHSNNSLSQISSRDIVRTHHHHISNFTLLNRLMDTRIFLESKIRLRHLLELPKIRLVTVLGYI